jgi:hypothetical protein
VRAWCCQAYALLVDETIHFLSPAMMFLVITVWCRKHQVSPKKPLPLQHSGLCPIFCSV